MERLQSDTEKILAISQSMIQPNHPYQGFTHGNRGTLIVNPRRQNINMLAGLRKFYEEYYSANIMCLCVSKKLGMIFRVRYNNLKHTEHMMYIHLSVMQSNLWVWLEGNSYVGRKSGRDVPEREHGLERSWLGRWSAVEAEI